MANDQLAYFDSLIQKYFQPKDWATAHAVMMAESGGNPTNIGDNYPIDTGQGPQTIPSVGLFQIRTLPGRPDPQTLMDPEFNVAYAAKMQKEQGWHPWSTYTSGAYQKFLQPLQHAIGQMAQAAQPQQFKLASQTPQAPQMTDQVNQTSAQSDPMTQAAPYLASSMFNYHKPSFKVHKPKKLKAKA